MASEPRWNQLVAQIASGLRRINSGASTGYWNTVRAVYEDVPDEWDASKLPALAVSYNLAQRSSRVYAGGSRTVSDVAEFVVEGHLKDDGKGGVSIQKACLRLAADIHRAIYVEPNLGLSFVKRVTFPISPEMSGGQESGEQTVVGFKYLVVVEYSYEDSAP